MPLPAGYIRQNPIQSRRGRNIATAQIVKETITDAAAPDLDILVAEHAGADAAGTTSMTMASTTNDVARNVVVTVTHASSVVAMSGVITGTDVYGKAQTEDWSVTATGTSKTFTGKKGFKTVSGITEVVAADASDNTIKAGTGKVFGLRNKASVASLIKEVAGGSVVTNGTLAAASAVATDDPRGTYAPNGTPDGSADYVLYYIVDDPGAID